MKIFRNYILLHKTERNQGTCLKTDGLQYPKTVLGTYSHHKFVPINIKGLRYKKQYKSNAPNFFSENVIAVRMKFTWMIHISFAIMTLFFYKDCHFQHTFANVE
jgi:hypothetical protein